MRSGRVAKPLPDREDVRLAVERDLREVGGKLRNRMEAVGGRLDGQPHHASANGA